MAIEVQGPDGSITKFKDGTPENAIRVTMAKKYGGPKAGKKPVRVAGITGEANTDAFLSGAIDSGSFGISDRVQAFGRTIGNALSGKRSFSPDAAATDLEEVRREGKQVRARSPGAAFAGEVAGSIVGGGGIGLGVRAGAKGLSAVGRSVASRRAGAAITNATTLVKGRRAGNIARLSGAGALTGAADAGGRGTDIATGATIGAIAAPALAGALKSVGKVGRVVASRAGLRSDKSTLREIVQLTDDSVQDAVAARQAVGIKPTIYEVLPMADRGRIGARIVDTGDTVREAVGEAVRKRVKAMPNELANVTKQATNPRRQTIILRMARELDKAEGRPTGRGIAPTREAVRTATKAARTPVKVRPLASREIEGIQSPVANIRVIDTIDELFPKAPVRTADGVTEEFTNPELNKLTREAASARALKTENGEGFTVAELSRIVSSLRGKSDDAQIGDLAVIAARQIEDIIAAKSPQAAEALEGGRTAFANRMSMGEGMAEGARTRLVENIAETGASAVQKTSNAFDTAPGLLGRQLGQTNTLEQNFTGATGQAFKQIDDIVDNPTMQETLRRNLSANAERQITQAAELQSTSLRNLSDVRNLKPGGEQSGEQMTRNLASAFLAVAPGSMIQTQARGVMAFLRQTMPEAQALRLADRLFSRDPRIVQETLRYIGGRVENGQAILRQMQIALIGGTQSGRIGEALFTPGETAIDQPVDEPEPMQDNLPVNNTPMQDDMPQDDGLLDEEQTAEEFPSYNGRTGSPGANAVMEVYPQAEITDTIRDPNSEVGRGNPSSAHIHTGRAVDVRPIPGMSFEEYVNGYLDAGYQLKYARDEVNNPSGHASGPHWHIEFL